MKRLLVPSEQINGMVARLSRNDRDHLVKALRLGPGDAIELCDGAGSAYRGVIAQISSDGAEIALHESVMLPPPRDPRVSLLYGLAKGQKSEWVLQKATEIGADQLIFVVCERSVARPAPNKQKRWQEIVRQAARQSQRTHLPELKFIPSFADALSALPPGQTRLIALPHAPALSGQRLTERDPVLIAVGPEGGFSPKEEAAAAEAGFVAVGLGPNILRSETAALAGLTLVMAATQRLT